MGYESEYTPRPRGSAKSFASEVSTRSTTDNISRRSERLTKSCVMCKGDHDLHNCDKFKALNLVDRRSFVKSKGLFQMFMEGSLV